jgi:hypothetical protein
VQRLGFQAIHKELQLADGCSSTLVGRCKLLVDDDAGAVGVCGEGHVFVEGPQQGLQPGVRTS